MQKENPLSKDISLDRRAKILEILESEGQVSVIKLSKKFNVSTVTIRNDLDQLEQKNLLVRTRGGALKVHRVGIDFHLYEKQKKMLNEKRLIGKKASELINEGDTIIIDSGSTTLEVAKNLKHFNNLTVLSNALNIAAELAGLENIMFIMLGGHLRNKSLSFVGPISEQILKNHYCDKVFLGVDGIDSTYGISTPNTEEAYLNKIMIENSKEIIVVADSSKFLKRCFSYIAPIERISTIVTDNKIPEEEYKRLKNNGIQVIIA